MVAAIFMHAFGRWLLIAAIFPWLLAFAAIYAVALGGAIGIGILAAIARALRARGLTA